MRKIMAKLDLSCDEVFPVYAMQDVGSGEVTIEVDDATAARWESISDDYYMMQSEMRNCYDDADGPL
jgi:hypothetical protein